MNNLIDDIENLIREGNLLGAIEKFNSILDDNSGLKQDLRMLEARYNKWSSDVLISDTISQENKNIELNKIRLGLFSLTGRLTLELKEAGMKKMTESFKEKLFQ